MSLQDKMICSPFWRADLNQIIMANFAHGKFFVSIIDIADYWLMHPLQVEATMLDSALLIAVALTHC